MQNLDEANRMLDTFASVGARHFDLTFLGMNDEKPKFRPKQTLAQLRNSLPKLFPGLSERRQSLVIRPHAEGVPLVQLDDLDATALERVDPVSFLTLCTSSGNHQAWVALDHVAAAGKMMDIGHRLRKGTGADLSASGATRIAGASNYKRKYEPDFPTVTIIAAHPGRIVSVEQLEHLLAPPEPVRATPIRVSSSRSWPDYQRCVEGAPLNHAKDGPDISRADFFYAKMAADRGHSIEEIAAGLMVLSTKAKENGERYARVTAENATAATTKQRSRG